MTLTDPISSCISEEYIYASKVKLVSILQRSAHDNGAEIRLLVSKKGTPLEHGACYLCEVLLLRF